MWPDDRAKMARFYEGLKDEIKNAMAILDFPTSWTDLIGLASRLDDNQRRRTAEKKGWHHKPSSTSHTKERHPDEMDWQASSATKQYRRERKTGRGKGFSSKKKGKWPEHSPALNSYLRNRLRRVTEQNLLVLAANLRGRFIEW
jgi:hypothetical protein